MLRRRLSAPRRDLRTLFAAVRAELDVPAAFPPDVEAAAAQAVDRVDLSSYDDLTEIPFATLDPVGSMDLDQAFHLERAGTGVRLRYAIADVAAVVAPAGPVDVEAHLRGVTLYSPDTRTPLHPAVLSEGSASLLPDVVRPAVVWTIDLDPDGEQSAVDLRRAIVRSRRRLDYEGVQRAIDGRTADDVLRLLHEVGTQRLEVERRRGGMSLRLPEQEVVPLGDSWTLRYRLPLPSEAWNAQLSLLTGMAAARIMLDAGTGVLRTMPDPERRDVERLRRVARGLRIAWSPEESYRSLVDRLDGSTPEQAAFLDEASVLFRGAAYTLLDHGATAPTTHAAVAAPYAHVTAPLRRLVDRYATEICVAATANRPVPEWVTRALPALPQEMAEADRRQRALERACVELMEAVVLEPMVGATVDGVVVDVRETGGGTVMLHDPAVMARCDGDLELGSTVQVRVVEADPETRSVRFEHGS